jgi:putative addiction module component (TIGR02574 family)
MSIAEIFAAAMKLSRKQKAKLAEDLLSSIDTDAQRAIDAKWAQELDDRVAAHGRGLIASTPIKLPRRSAR